MSVCPSYKKIEFFEIFNFFKYKCSCTAGRALLNYVKISRRKQFNRFLSYSYLISKNRMKPVSIYSYKTVYI